MKTEEKRVALNDSPFLKSLTGVGSTYQDYSPDMFITVVAVEGNYGDWAAYSENPQWPGRVVEYGIKLPKEVARELFPEWAKLFKWRP